LTTGNPEKEAQKVVEKWPKSVQKQSFCCQIATF